MTRRLYDKSTITAENITAGPPLDGKIVLFGPLKTKRVFFNQEDSIRSDRKTKKWFIKEEQSNQKDSDF